MLQLKLHSKVQRAQEKEEFQDRNIVVLVATAIVRDAKILVVREEDHPYNRHWVLPQGYLKGDESLIDAARREVREELGVDVVIQQPLGTYEDFVKEKNVKRHYIIICYLGRPAAGARIQASEEVIDFAWIDPLGKFDDAPPVVQRMLREAGEMIKKRRSLRTFKLGTG